MSKEMPERRVVLQENEWGESGGSKIINFLYFENMYEVKQSCNR
jgi:hypothetical protein